MDSIVNLFPNDMKLRIDRAIADGQECFDLNDIKNNLRKYSFGDTALKQYRGVHKWLNDNWDVNWEPKGTFWTLGRIGLTKKAEG